VGRNAEKLLYNKGLALVVLHQESSFFVLPHKKGIAQKQPQKNKKIRDQKKRNRRPPGIY
jgi:hypothetical protein